MVIVSPVSSSALSPGAQGELFRVDGDEHLGAFPAAGDGARVVGIREFDEGVGLALFAGAARFVETLTAHESVDGVAQYPPRFGFEQAL